MKRRMHIFVLGIFALIAAVGCTEAKEASKVDAAEEPIILAQATTEAAVGSGRAAGKILFEGEQPKLKKLNMNADPVCQGLHADVVRSETVLVNPNGTLRNVFVYVKEGLEGKTFPPVTEKAVLDQKGCMYDPHVLGVRVGQPIEIINSDDTLHNVHALCESNPAFNYGMPFKGMSLPAQCDKQEIMFKVKCDVHPWMSAYISAVDHPHFAVTGEDGTFDLGDVPPGEYTIEAWHEYYGTQAQKVTLPASEEIVFSFSHSKKA